MDIHGLAIKLQIFMHFSEIRKKLKIESDMYAFV